VLAHVCARDVDHLFARGFETDACCKHLPRDVLAGRARVALSDHVPLLAELRRGAHTSR
jgi:endonuclease/exonuclease/phosphatase family metal-dependent hydrolase